MGEHRTISLVFDFSIRVQVSSENLKAYREDMNISLFTQA